MGGSGHGAEYKAYTPPMTTSPPRGAHLFGGILVAATVSACTTGRAAAPTILLPEPGETHLRNIRQLTFGGNNAEAYFSPDGRRLIFQRQERADSGCDQQYVMNADGSDMRRVSNGLGQRRPPHRRPPTPHKVTSGRSAAPRSTLPARTAAISAASPRTMPTMPRQPFHRTESAWCSPAPGTVTSSCTV